PLLTNAGLGGSGNRHELRLALEPDPAASDHLGEHKDDVGIELAPRTAPQLLGRSPDREGAPVAPVGRHRAEGVATADDPRDQSDLAAGGPGGVASSAPPL